MAKGMKCDNCGKGIMYGHNVSHAKNRTRRIFKPNLHSARILIGAGYKTMRLCTKCLRLLKGKAKETTNTQEASQDQAPVVAAS